MACCPEEDSTLSAAAVLFEVHPRTLKLIMNLCVASDSYSGSTSKLLQQFGVDEEMEKNTQSFVKEWSADKASQVDALGCLKVLSEKLSIPYS
jgi:hypothetical protein